MNKQIICLWVFLGLFSSSQAHLQQIILKVDHQPIKEVLDQMAKEHDLQYTAAGERMENCMIHIDKEFDNLDQVVSSLAEACQLTVEKLEDVYIFHSPKNPLQPSHYTFHGRIVEEESGMPIPYVILQVNSNQVLADEEGGFTFQSPQKMVEITTRHLAYQALDTLIKEGHHIDIRLNQEDFSLEEVVIEADSVKHILSEKFEISRAFKEGRLKAGYYRSFDEFLQNKPGLTFQDSLFKDRKIGTVKWSSYVKHYYAVPDEEREQLGPIFGYSDGERIYFALSNSNKLTKDSFSPVTFLDNMACSYSPKITWKKNSKGSVSVWIDYNLRILYMDDKEYISYSSKAFKQLIKPNKELTKDFRKVPNKDKERKMKEFLARYVRQKLDE
ncbi:MAG: hypothetical protein AAFY71_19230 [Bacteroidota bacterium]